MTKVLGENYVNKVIFEKQGASSSSYRRCVGSTVSAENSCFLLVNINQQFSLALLYSYTEPLWRLDVSVGDDWNKGLCWRLLTGF